MENAIRDIFLITKNKFPAEEVMEQEMICLNKVLLNIENPEVYCLSHEYVNRNAITQNKNLILKASYQKELNAFCFLINKN